MEIVREARPLSSRRRTAAAIALVAIAAAITYVGWRLLWHMADDAYITYRYISNVMLGYGYTWNAAPFLPVDGNTDTAWLVILLFVWRVFGIEPPDSATWLSLGLGLATMLLLARALWRVALPEHLERVRVPLLGIGLALLVTNRGWLATLSTGMGIAIMNTVLFAWTLLAASPRTIDAPRRWIVLGALAGLCGVTRPEGYLAVLATALLLPWWGIAQRKLLPAIAGAVLAVTPMLAHMAWREWSFGDVWPCAFHAKTIGAWPQSGVRYLASFVVEYGVWVWLVPAVIWAVRHLRSPGPFVLLQPRHLGAAAAGSVLAVHFVYYTFFMGGDLFEWRVYSHLVPWLPLSFVLMVRSLPWRPRTVLAWFAAYAVLALPVGWLKFTVEDGPVAPHVPPPLSTLLAPYDDWQHWLSDRLVCKRNWEMKVNIAAFMANSPTREVGSRVPMDGFPVLAANAAGYVGWALPHVAIIDNHGLSDPVVARTPIATGADLLAQRRAPFLARFALVDADRDGIVTAAELQPALAALAPGATPADLERQLRDTMKISDANGDGGITRDEYLASQRLHGDRMMAHDRLPPPGYVEGFRPNVGVHAGHVEVTPRHPPLTAEDIRRHEAVFRERVGAPR